MRSPESKSRSFFAQPNDLLNHPKPNHSLEAKLESSNILDDMRKFDIKERNLLLYIEDIND